GDADSRDLAGISHRENSGASRTGRKHWGQTAPSTRRRGTRCFLERSCPPWDGVVSPRVFADPRNHEVSAPRDFRDNRRYGFSARSMAHISTSPPARSLTEWGYLAA